MTVACGAGAGVWTARHGPLNLPAAPTQPAAQPTKPAAAAPTATTKPAAAPTKFKEAPMLTELVKAGKLPALEQRLPPAPQVLKPLNEVGTVWRHGARGHRQREPVVLAIRRRSIGTELVLRIDKDFSTIVGGLFEAWQFNQNATEQTLQMRKGLKWSDGTPFTTADCLFDWEDCKLNKDLNPAGPPGRLARRQE